MAATYSFASTSSNPPPFSSRRTSVSTLTSTANSFHQASLVSSPPSHRLVSTRQVSTASTGLGSRFASFTSAADDTPASRVDIVDRPRDKTRQNEVNASALSFLFGEIVSYTQNRVTGVTDLEKRLSLIGYRVGQRVLGMAMHRQEMLQNSKNPKRETKLLPTLLWIHTAFWKAAFGKPADSLERSTEPGRSDECKSPTHAYSSAQHTLTAAFAGWDLDMISTNVPTFSRAICVPNDMSQLSVEAITAGMVEAALDGLGFPARVTAHTVGTPQYPQRTTILIKLDAAVMQREEALAS